jgi:hypothetical protein
MIESILKHGIYYSLEIHFRSGYPMDMDREMGMMDVIHRGHVINMQGV